MKPANKFRADTIRRLIVFLLLFSAVIVGFGCSQPILESNECIEARDPVKRFYSFHFGNEMLASKENIEKRKKYLSKRLNAELNDRSDTKFDYFTQTADYPKAFRAGKCDSTAGDRVKFEVLLFWRTNEKNSQRAIQVEMVKENSRWLIDRVESKE